MEIIVSKVKITYERSNGTNGELQEVMPWPILDKLLCEFITWRDDWEASFKDAEEYFKAEKEFLTSKSKNMASEFKEIVYETKKLDYSEKECPNCNQKKLLHGAIPCPDGKPGCAVLHMGYTCTNCGKVFSFAGNARKEC